MRASDRLGGGPTSPSALIGRGPSGGSGGSTSETRSDADRNQGFLGTHLFWWFGVQIIVGYASLFAPVPREQAKQHESPLALLQRRYAAGEISTEHYEQRPTVLVRDAIQGA